MCLSGESVFLMLKDRSMERDSDMHLSMHTRYNLAMLVIDEWSGCSFPLSV